MTEEAGRQRFRDPAPALHRTTSAALTAFFFYFRGVSTNMLRDTFFGFDEGGEHEDPPDSC
jgi:hypothetical protein